MATTDGGARVAWPARLASWWLLALLLVVAPAFAGPLPPEPMHAAPTIELQGPAPHIGVLTMAPGEVFWERFGHNAIVVAPADGSEAVSYNYGFFDLGEEGFIGKFIAGKMRYMLVALPVEEDLENYRERGRGVDVQWLALDDAQARSLAAALAENARPENAKYTYDYYTCNCSTRVRDMLDAALGGALYRQLVGPSQGNTYRTESVRLAWPAKWMAIGFDVGLTAYADRPLSRWDEAFIPMRLHDSLREIRRADGRPLVESEAVVLPHRLSLPPDEMPRLEKRAFFAGIVLALLVLWSARRVPRLTAAAATAFWLVCGLTGALMLFIWLGTAHVAGHGNENLTLLSPLAFALVPGGWTLLRGRTPPRWFDTWLWVVAGSAAVGGFLTFLPFLAQKNLDWVLLLLPVHLALARALSRPVAAAPVGGA
jgi:hypothetical protein